MFIAFPDNLFNIVTSQRAFLCVTLAVKLSQSIALNVHVRIFLIILFQWHFSGDEFKFSYRLGFVTKFFKGQNIFGFLDFWNNFPLHTKFGFNIISWICYQTFTKIKFYTKQLGVYSQYCFVIKGMLNIAKLSLKRYQILWKHTNVCWYFHTNKSSLY